MNNLAFKKSLQRPRTLSQRSFRWAELQHWVWSSPQFSCKALIMDPRRDIFLFSQVSPALQSSTCRSYSISSSSGRRPGTKRPVVSEFRFHKQKEETATRKVDVKLKINRIVILFLSNSQLKLARDHNEVLSCQKVWTYVIWHFVPVSSYFPISFAEFLWGQNILLAKFSLSIPLLVFSTSGNSPDEPDAHGDSIWFLKFWRIVAVIFDEKSISSGELSFSKFELSSKLKGSSISGLACLCFQGLNNRRQVSSFARSEISFRSENGPRKWIRRFCCWYGHLAVTFPWRKQIISEGIWFFASESVFRTRSSSFELRLDSKVTSSQRCIQKSRGNRRDPVRLIA